jgi:universal stress protein A
MITLNTILLAIDFSEASNGALTYASQLARTFGSTLHVLHVTADLMASMVGVDAYHTDFGRLQARVEEDARRELHALLSADCDGMRLEAAVITSCSPADVIVSYARENRIDLIVVGTHGRTGMPHLFLGSVAERVVRLAPCAVLTVRPPVAAVASSVHEAAVCA